MIIYNKTSLNNLRIHNLVKKWKDKNLIGESTFEKINSAHEPGLYIPNLFIRIGLFIFTSIIISASLGLITLISFGNSGYGYGSGGVAIRCFIYALLVGATAEFIIKEKKLFSAGSDDALQYATVLLALSGIISSIDYIVNDHYEWESYFFKWKLFISFPVLLLASIRYVDRLLSAITFVCFTLLLFLITYDAGTWGKILCPFVIAAFSFLIYWLIRKFAYSQKLLIWKDNFKVLELLGLLTFYLSLNYFVVRELNALINYSEDTQIPFAWLFYITTAVIPFAYMYFGIAKKDRLHLQLGLMLFAFAVFTFKYYFSLGHHEITITLAGAMMIGFAWYVSKILKTPKWGLTLEKEAHSEFDLTDAEALIIAQTMGKENEQAQGMEFGGGNFGGGGGGGNF